jgi:hypothetical protein
MVIKQFITKNTSEDPEKKQLVISKDEDKYCVEDLVFVSQFIDNEDEEEEEVANDTPSVDNDEGEESEDWLKELMGE